MDSGSCRHMRRSCQGLFIPLRLRVGIRLQRAPDWPAWRSLGRCPKAGVSRWGAGQCECDADRRKSGEVCRLVIDRKYVVRPADSGRQSEGQSSPADAPAISRCRCGLIQSLAFLAMVVFDLRIYGAPLGQVCHVDTVRTFFLWIERVRIDQVRRHHVLARRAQVATPGVARAP